MDDLCRGNVAFTVRCRLSLYSCIPSLVSSVQFNGKGKTVRRTDDEIDLVRPLLVDIVQREVCQSQRRVAFTIRIPHPEFRALAFNYT